MIRFAGYCTYPDIGDKVKLFLALAPIGTVGHIKGAFKVLDIFFALFGVYDFLLSNNITKWIAQQICGNDYEAEEVCEDILFLAEGPSTDNLNITRLPIYLSHSPAGTSTKNVLHFSQEVNSDKFRMFDYGTVGNRKEYGTLTPPEYQPSKMKVPVALFHSAIDWQADPEDVDWLVSQLQTVVFSQSYDEYSHLDFVWSYNAHNDVYRDVVTLLQQYK